jgi:hypothetical protein
MKLKVSVLGAVALLGIVALASKPQPAEAFACSTTLACGLGCKTVLGSGPNEGVHCLH